MAIVAVAVLAGCANPILDVRAPGYSLPESPAPARDPQSMEEAQAKLSHLRAQYYQAIREHSGTELASTVGLVWLGTVVAGMAVGDVHRDAILGATAIGGTTYGLARTQIDARRTQVWTAGMEALDCARAATLPLDLGESRRGALQLAIAALEQRMADVLAAQRRVRSEQSMPAVIASPDKRQATATLLVSSDDIVAEAGGALAGAGALLHAARGGELSATVDRVHTQVTRALREIAVSIESIKASIAGLGGFAAVIAPGAGVDTLIDSSMSAYREKLTKSNAQAGGPTPALDDAVNELEKAMKDLGVAEVRLAGMVQGVDLAAVSAALRACQVSGVATALALKPASLQFEPGKAIVKGFEITGGTPPYSVTALDPLPDALSLQFSGGLSDTAQVKATKDVAEGSFRLRVTDSSAVKGSRQLEIAVGTPAKAGAGTPSPAAAQPAGATEWKKLGEELLKKSPLSGVQGKTVKITAAEPTSTGVTIRIQCEPAGAISAQILKDRLVVGLADAAKVLDNEMSQLKVVAADASCQVGP